MPSPCDHAASLSFFLLAQVSSVCGTWRGKLSAAEQRALFGTFLGKGTIVIDGATETIQHIRKIAFGMDWEVTQTLHWRDCK